MTVTMEQVLQKFLDREEAHAAAWSQLHQSQQNQRGALESLQVDVQRILRLQERQDGINTRQIELAERTQSHGQHLDRAFAEIHALRQDFLQHVKDQAPTKDLVTKASGGVRVLVLVGGIITALLAVIGTTWRDGLAEQMLRLEGKIEREIGAADIKHDALSSQIQELRIARQRDLEEEQ